MSFMLFMVKKVFLTFAFPWSYLFSEGVLYVSLTRFYRSL
jgi:hypothetical protein